MRVWKLQGAGNDFVLVDGRGGPALARRLCDRRLGVGADGLLAVKRGETPSLHYWNSDGSEAFCGNGTRCAALWLFDRGLVKSKSFILRTGHGPLEIKILAKDRAAVRMPAPGAVHVPRAVDGLEVLQVDTGVPHAVVFVDALDEYPVFERGRALRRHKAFAPAGANVDFVQINGRSSLSVRTYERGVEDETLACGTGVVASALAAALLHGARSPISVQVKSGDRLTARFSRAGAGFSDVWLEGPGEIVFEGKIA